MEVFERVEDVLREDQEPLWVIVKKYKGGAIAHRKEDVTTATYLPKEEIKNVRLQKTWL